jgi:MFS family permease
VPGSVRSPSRTTFSQVFAVGEFRALWLAQVLSVGGDQLARVALTLLVYDRTHSPLLAAVTYAASIVPAFVGGIALSGLADRLPRREVMIGCDLSQAALVAVMALPGVPLPALIGLLFAVTTISAPFRSARTALYADILPGDQYVLGTAITQTTMQVAQVAGFAAGGAVAGFFGARTSLAADAVTFALSALITATRVGSRSAPAMARRARWRSLSGAGQGARLVFTDPRLRTPMLLGWMVAFVDIYEGIAAPLARSLGGGAVATGLILASGALGASVGAVMFSRMAGPATRLRLMGPLAIAACAVLTPFALRPGLVVALVILTASGALCCYQVAASSAFVAAAPPSQRSQAFGIAQGGIALAQGAAMVIAGAAARYVPPPSVIALGGAVGVAAAGLIVGFGTRHLEVQRPGTAVQ